MVKRVGSIRRKTRRLLSVPKKQKGKLAVTRFLQKLNNGDKVVLKAAPTIQDGQSYYRRFHGKTGTVTGRKGKCYEVRIKDKDKIKNILVKPVHLMRVQVQNGT